MKPYLSIVIPYHNDPDTIGRLLTSIKKSKGAPLYEIIAVDDGSDEELTAASLRSLTERKIATSSDFRRSPRYDKVSILRLPHNIGPAVARNRGVEKAKGEFIVFLDSDVELFPDTLKNLAKVFQDDPDVVALTGVWVKEQHTKAFFPNFKALRDWSYWIHERDMSGYYFLFSTRIASIKRSVFLRLGGFDEQYPAPLVEDIELTYRIARRYAIIFAPNVRVKHEFESFWPIAKKYFLRAYYWTKLYNRRKKFDPVATTFWEALTAVTGVAVALLGPISIFLLPSVLFVSSVKCQVSEIFLRAFCYYPLFIWGLFFLALLLHVFMVRRFLTFVYKEKGIGFAVKGFFMGLVLYCVIFAGAAAGKLRS